VSFWPLVKWLKLPLQFFINQFNHLNTHFKFMKLKLQSEFGSLNTVITHRPGHEIERLTPYNTSELLFEDVPYLEVMQKEHDVFTSLIRQAGAEVLRLHDLLVDVLLDEKILVDLFKHEFTDHKLGHRAGEIIERYSTAECANILVAGLRVKELKRKYNCKELEDKGENEYLIQPSPNQYFMRDPAAIVQTGVINSSMKFPSRQRESNLVRIIFENHPKFKGAYYRIYPENGQAHSIEGGDVIVLSDHALAIGNSERTDRKAIEEVARQVMKEGNVQRVYEVDLPPKRNFMHLDTVFTMIDENLIVTYPDAMDSILRTSVWHADEKDDKGNLQLKEERVNESIISILKKEIPYLEVIETGAGNPDFASREQWYDGANVFAVGPRRVISYNRNKFTNRALREIGVEVLEIPSSELSRGLGGPRCMTMPVDRNDH
jgi:arginine deiminase